MDDVEVLREAFRRLATTEPVSDLFTDDYARESNPPFWLAHLADSPIEQRTEDLRQQGFTFVLKDAEQAAPGRVVFSATWDHRGPSGGSAGLYWGVAQIREGRIARLRYCTSRDEALRAVGLP